MRFVFHWGCLLIFALFAPIALPAGGAMRDKRGIVADKVSRFCFAGDDCRIRSSPSFASSSLYSISLGTPLTILMIWPSDDGTRWAQVQLQTGNFSRFSPSTPRRGWINV